MTFQEKLIALRYICGNASGRDVKVPANDLIDLIAAYDAATREHARKPKNHLWRQRWSDSISVRPQKKEK